jgi:F-type H+-transporting ATPase subunit a
MLALIVISLVVHKKLKKRPDGWQVLVEKGVSMLYNMVRETMGEHNLHWTPFIGTIFLSSILGSFIGLTGFLRSSTADISCVMVWALMVSAICWYNGIKHNGFLGWLKGFTQPIAVMTPMNIISEIAQPVSMAFRHFGNVAGGGVITSILDLALSLMSGAVLKLFGAGGLMPGILSAAVGGALIIRRLVKKRGGFSLFAGIVLTLLGACAVLQALGLTANVPVLAFGVPAVLSCYFDLFSGFVQAYVFTLLSMVYIGNSCPAPETDA